MFVIYSKNNPRGVWNFGSLIYITLKDILDKMESSGELKLKPYQSIVTSNNEPIDVLS